MKIKTLLIVSLLFALWAGNTNAQNSVTLPLVQDFEAGLGSWDAIGSQYSGIRTEMANEANHIYRFAGSTSIHAYLISPELESSEDGVSFAFDYTNYYKDTYFASFRVGYSTFSNDLEDFVWGELVTATNGDFIWSKNTGTGDWKQFVCDFPVGVKYVAIYVPPTNTGATNLFVDNIVVSTALCTLPSSLRVAGITDESISISWQGNSSSYDVQCARYSDFEEGEEALVDFSANPEDENGWRSFGDIWGSVQQGTWLCDAGWYFSEEIEGHNGSSYCAYSSIYDMQSEGDNYLISPRVALGDSISFYARCQVPSIGGVEPFGKSDDVYLNTTFKVQVCVEGQEPVDFTSIDFDDLPVISGVETTLDYDWKFYTFSLEQFEGEEGYVIIRHINDVSTSKETTYYYCYLLIDDVTIYERQDDTEYKNYTFGGLNEATKYVFRVRGNGDGDVHSTWTAPLYARTFPENPAEMPDSYIFITQGEWNMPSNWQDWYIPQNVTDNVNISADAIIPEGCVAQGTITMDDGSITIKDGGQLKHNNAAGNISVTAKKRIAAYPAEGKTGYYLIASPVGAMPNTVANLLSNDYDLYSFDQSEELEWQNYKTHTGTFVLNPYQGYLYANNNNVTLSFMGEIESSEDEATGSLEYDNNAEFPGWNLVGNPFMCNAYIGRPFYRLTPESEDLVSVANGAIAPLEGVFVQAVDEDDNEITFSRNESSKNGKASVLNVNVVRNEANVDVAHVRFGEGRGLEKFQLNPNHTKVYFPQNGKNYAVVNVGSIDELPFSFEAENNDTFTLNFTQEQVEFSYLHLIDNLTGANIDLLQQPEYTFESKVSDYPSRFKVVFVAKDAEGAVESSEAFAFNSNGDFIIVNEGQATLQVIDLQGRMISSETIEGCVNKSIQVAPGVYVLRLINGENIKAQKVVVR